MHQRFLTLRFSLAILYLIVFGVIQTALCLTVLFIRESDLRGEFDERLRHRAAGIIYAVAAHRGQAPDLLPSGAARGGVNPLRAPGYYVQLRGLDGVVFERSPELEGQTLPLSARAAAAVRSETPVLETLTEGVAESLVGRGGELRLLTLYDSEAAPTPFYLQAALNLTPVKAAVARLRHIFMFLIPLGLLASGFAASLVARRSLAPIGRIARQAQDLTAMHLDRRIEVPPGHDEVAQMAVVINQMLDRLQAGFLAQERFIADVSHELKTPLTVLLGEAQVLVRELRGVEEYRRFAASAVDEMRRVARIVDGLLTLARADAGMPLPAVELVSINDVVMDVVQRYEPQARQHGVRLLPTLSMPEHDQPAPAVAGDALLLGVMFENLVRNAVRHSSAGDTVQLNVDPRDSVITVRVTDQGPGIPAEYVDKVFDRYFRVPHGSGADRGIGLGLAIVKAVAALHRGSVSVANCAERGSEFTVRLPVADSG